MISLTELREAGHAAAQATPAPQADISSWQRRWLVLKKQIQQLLKLIERAPAAAQAAVPNELALDAWNWLKENPRSIRNAMLEIDEHAADLTQLPRSVASGWGACPRVLRIAEELLPAMDYTWHAEGFAAFLEGYQQTRPLETGEIWALPVAIKLAILHALLAPAQKLLESQRWDEETACVPRLMAAFQALGVAAFTELLEPLLPVEHLLQQDPIYAQMDAASRQRYRTAVTEIARRSAYEELQVARIALGLAQAEAAGEQRQAARRRHVGFYLIAEGRPELLRRVDYRPSLNDRLRSFISAHAADVYISAAWLFCLLLIALVIAPILRYTDVLSGLGVAFLLTIVPASQAAVEIVNRLVSNLFPPQALPKLDFSRGVPPEFATLITVPVLLLDAAQARATFDDLEVRYLANRDPNLHFALLTDLPDTADAPEDDNRHPLVELARDHIAELNRRYAPEAKGAFFLLHRHRVFNRHQGVWMGWERKRGKLLDLNRLLRAQYDSFPVKEGPLERLPQINYVLTLDADTALPRDAARQMLGTLAHPLNRAIVDSTRRVVSQGYGILQPRVGISVHSAARSRLARIYSGETGLDIYSRAVSDVYQDLFHEGIFTGKGLYEVDTLRAVLEQRFPNNALLSHDLIEGAYARVGLASDIEVIDDYPSHLSAWARRKHRWTRGDWQITQWLFPRVPEEMGRLTANPIALISRWKIFDNLRRSIVQPATFLLLVAGWLRLPGGPRYWTLVTLGLLFLPVYVEFAVAVSTALIKGNRLGILDAFGAFVSGHVALVLSVVFLLHQALLSLDAIVRTLVRRFVTGKKLLEWETAAEAEHGRGRRTPVEVYLRACPLVAAAIAGLVVMVNAPSLPFGAPLLVLWASAEAWGWWLDRPQRDTDGRVDAAARAFLRRVALLTWRFFAEFSTADENWLVPDNVEERDTAIAHRVSPTNVGLLLNARQVAQRLGFLTMPEFAQLSSATLATLEKLEKFSGHLLNWYDTRSLTALPPRIVSAVDSGNLAASLLTLSQGARQLLQEPLFPAPLLSGLTEIEQEGANDAWWQQQSAARRNAIERLRADYLPWSLPDWSALLNALHVSPPALETITLDAAPQVCRQLDQAIANAAAVMPQNDDLYARVMPLRLQLTAAGERCLQLRSDLVDLAARARTLADAMDFALLLHPLRKLLSIAYNVDRGHIEDACYDLLASEARTAVFLAIAKGDISQESWFRLGRAHVTGFRPPVLISWTGTMFEYLMPHLWMHAPRNSLLDRTQRAAVLAQQRHVAARGVPWGISEAGYATLAEDGHYLYHAFGLPELAVSPDARDGGPVIAPYACCLALPVSPRAAIKNLRAMQALGWLTPRGFYESADYSLTSRETFAPQLVRSWMAHHQGISLLALLNVLEDNLAQRWFHSDKRVQSAALLLAERPMKAASLPRLRYTGKAVAKSRRRAAEDPVSSASTSA